LQVDVVVCDRTRFFVFFGELRTDLGVIPELAV